MLREVLSEEVKRTGLELVQFTDSIGFSPLAAMWVRDRDQTFYRLYLVTPLIDTIGRMVIYDRLLTALEAEPASQNWPTDDFALGHPQHEPFQALSDAVTSDAEMVEITDFPLGPHYDALIYRPLRHIPDAAEVQKIEKTFLETVAALEHAA